MSEKTKIEMKLDEELKPLKKICVKLEETVSREFDKGIENIDTKEMGEAIDMLKDVYEAKEKIIKSCYYKYILSAMEKEEDEEKEMRKMMEKMRESGSADEDDSESRRFYRGQPRNSNGRFMSRRRGYDEMIPYYMADNYEYYRDMDRTNGRMYYSGGGNMGSGNYSDNSSASNSGRNSRDYSNGYNDGQRRGYSEGYSDGERRSGQRDRREGRSGMSRKTYMESKEMHKGNTSEDKQMKMKELENYMNELSSDMTELISDASNEEKTLLKQKLQVLAQKI